MNDVAPQAPSYTPDAQEVLACLCEAELEGELPEDHRRLDLWLAGSVSPRATQELSARGWQVHDHAWKALSQGAAKADPPADAAREITRDVGSR